MKYALTIQVTAEALKALSESERQAFVDAMRSEQARRARKQVAATGERIAQRSPGADTQFR